MNERNCLQKARVVVECVVVGVWRGGRPRFTWEESGEEGAYVRASTKSIIIKVGTQWTLDATYSCILCIFGIVTIHTWQAVIKPAP